MNNIKLLILGLVVFIIAIVIRTTFDFPAILNNVILLIALIITVTPLYRLVFNKLKK